MFDIIDARCNHEDNCTCCYIIFITHYVKTILSNFPPKQLGSQSLHRFTRWVWRRSLADNTAHQKRRQHPFYKSQALLHVALMQLVVLHDKKYKSLQWMTLHYNFSATVLCITCDPIHHLDSPNVVTLYWCILHTTRVWSVVMHIWIKCICSAIVKFRQYAESHLL